MLHLIKIIFDILLKDYILRVCDEIIGANIFTMHWFWLLLFLQWNKQEIIFLGVIFAAIGLDFLFLQHHLPKSCFVIWDQSWFVLVKKKELCQGLSSICVLLEEEDPQRIRPNPSIPGHLLFCARKLIPLCKLQTRLKLEYVPSILSLAKSKDDKR